MIKSDKLDNGSSSATLSTSGAKGEDTLEASTVMSSDRGEKFAEGKKVFEPSPNIAPQMLGFEGFESMGQRRPKVHWPPWDTYAGSARTLPGRAAPHRARAKQTAGSLPHGEIFG